MLVMKKWTLAAGGLGLTLLAVGWFIGLVASPPERHMGDVTRIMYAHVPSAWVSLLSYTIATVFACLYLWGGDRRREAWMVGWLEIGLVLNVLLLIQGSIWGKATWGVWWDWDVRLTTSLVMAFLFAGVLALRSFVDDDRRRAAWTAVATILSYADVPLVYFCVRWWRSLHQVQSTPSTVDPAMVVPLRLSAFGMLGLAIALAAGRALLVERRRLREATAYA